jgi:hypothetical protein
MNRNDIHMEAYKALPPWVDEYLDGADNALYEAYDAVCDILSRAAPAIQLRYADFWLFLASQVDEACVPMADTWRDKYKECIASQLKHGALSIRGPPRDSCSNVWPPEGSNENGYRNHPRQ